MNSASITKRQQYWREHVLAAATHDGSVVEYSKLHDLKTKDIYQWKTSLIKKGFLPVADNHPSVDFIPVQPMEEVAAVTAAHPEETKSVSCRITLTCGAVVELLTPIAPSELPRLLTALHTSK